jgi:hypothetical protein
MSWILIVVAYGCAMQCIGHDFKIALTIDTYEQCQTAREEFSKIPGFRKEFLLCIRGRAINN